MALYQYPVSTTPVPLAQALQVVCSPTPLSHSLASASTPIASPIGYPFLFQTCGLPATSSPISLQPIVYQSQQSVYNRQSELLQACHVANMDMIVSLIEKHKIDPNFADLSGNTPLHYAALNGHIQVVRILIENGADANSQDSSRNTPLHLAAQCGHTRTVQVLIECGHADPALLNNEGKTPFQLANDYGHGQNKIMRQSFQSFLCAPNHHHNSHHNNNNSVHYQNQYNDHTSLKVSSHFPAATTTKPKRERRLSQLPPTPSLLPIPAMLDTFQKSGIYFPIGVSYNLLCTHFHAKPATTGLPSLTMDPERSLRAIQENLKLSSIEELTSKLEEIEKSFAKDLLYDQELIRRSKPEYIEYENRRMRHRIEKFNRSRVMDNHESDNDEAYKRWRLWNHGQIRDLLAYLNTDDVA